MITGIEILKFGVEDRAASNKFLADFGLKQSQSDIEGTDLYQTQNGSKIYLFDCDDQRLPKAIESGSTLREVTWGLDDAAQDLANLTLRLNDVDGFQATADMVQCLDPNGMTIRFQKSFTQD
ncbi:MAG: glyoxalase, partial [Acinetobacter sp.]|nr:glyoxalase [Acinetobacter sp.]